MPARAGTVNEVSVNPWWVSFNTNPANNRPHDGAAVPAVYFRKNWQLIKNLCQVCRLFNGSFLSVEKNVNAKMTNVEVINVKAERKVFYWDEDDYPRTIIESLVFDLLVPILLSMLFKRCFN